MRVTVTVPVFKDKQTGAYHRQGAVIDVTKERYEEIIKAGKFVEPVTPKRSSGKKNDSQQSEDEQPAQKEPEPDPELLQAPGMPAGVQYIEDIKK